jgi:hypothetical protein
MQRKKSFHRKAISTFLSQCSSNMLRRSSSHSEREAMKVALASSSWAGMLALFPPTLGVGTAALWSRGLEWPLRVDADGMTSRRHRKVPWGVISRIGASRSYLDGYVCGIRFHHHGSVANISVRGLRDGEQIAGAILTMIKRTCGNRWNRVAQEIEPRPDENGAPGTVLCRKQTPEGHHHARRAPERVNLSMNSDGNCQ